MELDFTALNRITAKGVQEDFKEAQPDSQPTGQPADTGRAVNLLNAEQQEREKARQVYAEHQQNIKRAGTLREEIIKGIQQEEDPLTLLLSAIECISLMTGDTAIYDQCKGSVRHYKWNWLNSEEGQKRVKEEALYYVREEVKQLENIQREAKKVEDGLESRYEWTFYTAFMKCVYPGITPEETELAELITWSLHYEKDADKVEWLWKVAKEVYSELISKYVTEKMPTFTNVIEQRLKERAK